MFYLSWAPWEMAAEETAAGFSAERFEGALLAFWGGSGRAAVDAASSRVVRGEPRRAGG